MACLRRVELQRRVGGKRLAEFVAALALALRRAVDKCEMLVRARALLVPQPLPQRAFRFYTGFGDLIDKLQPLFALALRVYIFRVFFLSGLTKIRSWDSTLALFANEYHVQSLLMLLLRPIFPDLKDEESVPSVGHAHPRVDFIIPSMRLVIEVKFIRKGTQEELRRVAAGGRASPKPGCSQQAGV